MNIKRKIHNLVHPEIGRVLMFHRVTEAGEQLAVTPSRLREILQLYQEKGFEFIRIEDVDKHHDSRFLCVTFDDGYLDTLTMALPVLKEYSVPFCVYLTTGFYSGGVLPKWNPKVEMMNTHHVLQLASESLCTIGGHTVSHPHLSTLGTEQQRVEIFSNKEHLESLIGRSVEHFSYPHGDYNQTTIDLLMEAGYKTAVTCSGRRVRDDSRLLELDRVFAK